MNWERRRDGEATMDYLGRVLDDYLDLPDMAQRARAGHFDDFFCPPEVDDGLNLHRLLWELAQTAHNTNRAKRLRIREVVTAVKDGEFDGTAEESERWMHSEEGQAVLRDLVEGR